MIMKKILFLLVMLPIMCFGQSEEDKNQSKIDLFMSEIGAKVKFVDYRLKDLSGGYIAYKAETSVRKVIKGGEVKYFYRIEPKRDGVNNPITFIEYQDLKIIKDAIASLKTEIEDDISTNPDYLENKFVTEDYFCIGYYIKKKEIMWFIRLDKYGTNKHLYFTSVEPIEEGVNSAISKIEELMK